MYEGQRNTANLFASMKDVPTLLFRVKEVYAQDTEQRMVSRCRRERPADMKDVPTTLSMEEFVKYMEQ